MTPEEIKKRQYAKLMTNMLFVVADCLESLMVECDEANRDAGFVIIQEAKRNLNKARQGIKSVRTMTRQLPVEDQISFGDDGEITLDLLMAALSRTGTRTDMMVRFIEYIMTFPDRVGLDEFRVHGGETFNGIIKAKYGKGNNSHAHDDMLPCSPEPVQ